METNRYSHKAGLASLARHEMPNEGLEKRIITAQEPEEAEDPPETLHTTWGVWLHKRDALHGVDQRYDTEHILRTIRAADDILHYYHYVPVIEGHEHMHGPFEADFEYDYSEQSSIYHDADAEEAEEPEASREEDTEEKQDIGNNEDRDEDEIEEEKENTTTYKSLISEEILNLIIDNKIKKA